MFEMQALYLLCVLNFTILLFTASATNKPLPKPGCQTKCGNVIVPYPFGIGADGACSLSEPYIIYCNSSFYHPPKAFLDTNNTLEVVDISINGQLRIKNSVAYQYYSISDSVSAHLSLEGLPMVFSDIENKLTVLGCDDYALNIRTLEGINVTSGCITGCSKLSDVVNASCSGFGCCQTSIPKGLTYFVVELQSFNHHRFVSYFNPNGYAFLGEYSEFSFKAEDLSDPAFKNKIEKNVPIVLHWYVGNNNGAAACNDHVCQNNTNCTVFDAAADADGFRCNCLPGYEGNPYLTPGCTDINECASLYNRCSHICTNIAGSYKCSCPKGRHGDGFINGNGCIRDPSNITVITKLSTGIGGGVICLLLVGILLYWKHGERRIKKMRESFFRQNGGLLLHEKLRGRQVDTLKIFTMQHLELATKNFSDENVVGRGGFGLVYKGILPDKQIVAIKKSLKVDPNQVEQFINEVIVLSQIKNKYVVKLRGCCLEGEVPLLVYEFISNGTLYDHLNDGLKASILKWPLRLNIASQVANVLSYLHDTITSPIIHGDMKSMNILLDESYTAKVIDFGASKLITPDQSQFATVVLGTRGYLDPEYLQTSELTKKSDVYSFGVVLVELLTRKKAISLEWLENDKCLAKHFLLKMKEGCLPDILDKKIVSETTIEGLQQVANLAKWCLMLKADERPTMKEVATELEIIQRKGSHPWNEDGLVQGDCESLLTGDQRSNDYGACSSGIESNVYNSELLSSLEIGR